MSVGAVVACCALAAACTQEPAQMSSPSPTPLATTPRESQIERQMRLDYEAAEEAYRTNIAEQDRLYQAGGAIEATPALEGDGDRLLFADHVSSRFAMIQEPGWQATAARPRSSASCADGGWQERSSWAHQLRGQQRRHDSSTNQARM